MNDLLPVEAVQVKDGKLVTTSLVVAKVFGKKHYNVLRDIEALECSKEFTALNFEGSDTKDVTGRTIHIYNITKDGLTFLVMGYRGKKAGEFKEAYIIRFNEMEQELTANASQVTIDKTVQDLQSQNTTNPILNKPHIITIQDINFLTYIETRQIRKNLEGEVKYYTKAETGESGISFQGLANACGGVSAKTLREILAKYADPYLTEDIIKDKICEPVIHYFAFEAPQKKTKAKEIHRDFAYYGIKTFIQKKTDYPAQLAINHDASLELSIEAKLQQENKILQLELAANKARMEELAAENNNLKCQPRLEKTYQSRVQEIMGGQREIYLSHPLPGRVDLITNQCVVEIKKLENFSSAFGQLLHYRAKLQGTEHEQKTYVVYLFGKVTEDEKQVLEKMADLAQFQLIIDKEIKDFMDEDEMTTKDKLRMVIG